MRRVQDATMPSTRCKRERLLQGGAASINLYVTSRLDTLPSVPTDYFGGSNLLRQWGSGNLSCHPLPTQMPLPF